MKQAGDVMDEGGGRHEGSLKDEDTGERADAAESKVACGGGHGYKREREMWYECCNEWVLDDGDVNASCLERYPTRINGQYGPSASREACLDPLLSSLSFPPLDETSVVIASSGSRAHHP